MTDAWPRSPDAHAPRRRGRIALWAFRAALAAAVLFLVIVACLIVWMPGRSYRGPLPALSPAESALSAELRRDVVTLATDIGPRCVGLPNALRSAADFIARELKAAGYTVERQPFEVERVPCFNLAVELPGTVRPNHILVVGAHYDTVPDTPGANDNGSAVAALLALARRFAGHPCDCTLRFVAFANEEPPFFQTEDMGSLRYAQRCRERNEHILGMISLETMGYYSDHPGSQQYPWPFSLFYPSRGDFIGFVGNLASRRFVRQVVAEFRRTTQFPSEGAAIPGVIPQAGWSDHWAFWEQGYPALMVTDTAPFRYPHYHTPRDTPDKLDFDRLARVVTGLERTIRGVASAR